VRNLPALFLLVSSLAVRGGEIPTSRLRQIPRDLVVNREALALDQGPHAALLEMAADAEAEGIHLRVSAGFRSEGARRRMDASRKGEARRSAEWEKAHATGRAVDFAPANRGFASTKAYRWLKLNARKYGFSESLRKNPAGSNEPWRFNFISR